MEFSICVETPEGDSLVLLSGRMRPQIIPDFALKFAEIRRFIPSLTLVINGHTLTQLTFTMGNCSLQGEVVHYREGGMP